MFDLLIKNGFVIDGSGQNRTKSDIGITGEKISFIGDSKGKEAKESINGDLIATNDNRTFVGTPQTVRQKLQPILDKVDPEELKIITICEPLSARVRSYDLIKQSFAIN